MGVLHLLAAGNLIGPLVLGGLADSVGRKRMIAGTYGLSAVLLAFRAVLFNAGDLNATTQTLCWCVIFFFASSGASAAYPTVSEIFPVEVRAKAIAVFFAIAQSFGAFGPWFYGELIGDGHDHFKLFVGYMIGDDTSGAGGAGESHRRARDPLRLVRRRHLVPVGGRPRERGHSGAGQPSVWTSSSPAA